MSQKNDDGKKTGRLLSLRLPPDLEEAVEKAEKRLGLSKTDIACLAIERGLKELQAQISAPVTAAS